MAGERSTWCWRAARKMAALAGQAMARSINPPTAPKPGMQFNCRQELMDRTGLPSIPKTRGAYILRLGRAQRECMAKAAEFFFRKMAARVGGRLWIEIN